MMFYYCAICNKIHVQFIVIIIICISFQHPARSVQHKPLHLLLSFHNFSAVALFQSPLLHTSYLSVAWSLFFYHHFMKCPMYPTPPFHPLFMFYFITLSLFVTQSLLKISFYMLFYPYALYMCLLF